MTTKNKSALRRIKGGVNPHQLPDLSGAAETKGILDLNRDHFPSTGNVRIKITLRDREAFADTIPEPMRGITVNSTNRKASDHGRIRRSGIQINAISFFNTRKAAPQFVGFFPREDRGRMARVNGEHNLARLRFRHEKPL